MPTTPTADNQDRSPGSTKSTWAIFLISVLSLFLEMLLIRWVSTEISIFAYLQNTILVACFLGLGIGYFTSRQPVSLRHTFIPLTVLLVLMAIPFIRLRLGLISGLLAALDDLLIWEASPTADPMRQLVAVIVGLFLTFCLLVFVVDIFVPMGRMLGRLLDSHSNAILAYSVNIAGSLVGTWLFVFLSFLQQPPVVWFLVVGGLGAILVIWFQLDRKPMLLLLGGIALLGWFAGYEPNALGVIWSPYQKLVVYALPQNAQTIGQYYITVNSASYQEINDLSAKQVASDPVRYPVEWRGLSQYDLPLLFHPDPQSYLIVGAGTGNDVAAGVREGVKSIIAVDIDPAIIAVGRQLHPEHPYDSPNVEVVNDDARAFFATTQKKYDVITFGLLDSHTTTAMTNARLDSYVYTQESIAHAKALLKQGGILVLDFYVQRIFIADRMARLLKETFGEDPIVISIPSSGYGRGGMMFIAGDLAQVRRQMDQNQRLGNYVRELQQMTPLTLPLTTKVATDDWPYTYLESARIPSLYYLLAGLMIILFFRSSRRWRTGNFISNWQRSHWHFFFLGAAFLLLEVQNISKASVVLGNTWETNAAIISGVLVMALLANWVMYRFHGIKIGPAYVALIGICLALYFVDLAEFAFLPYLIKVIVIGCLTTLPMFFSGLIFIRSFTRVEGKDEALGANTAGALVGALLQSVTFVVGIKALLLIVAGLYFLSFLVQPRRLASADDINLQTQFDPGAGQ